MVRAVAVIVVVMSVMACGAVLAQVPAGGEDKVTMQLKDADVRSAIEALFRGRGTNYVIDASATGSVPAASFTDVPFQSALKQITRSAGLVFRMDSDTHVYVITKRLETTPNREPAPRLGSEIDCVTATTEDEFRIDKVVLSNTSASELLAMLNQGAVGGRAAADNRQSAGGFNPYGSSPGAPVYNPIGAVAATSTGRYSSGVPTSVGVATSNRVRTNGARGMSGVPTMGGRCR